MLAPQPFLRKTCSGASSVRIAPAFAVLTHYEGQPRHHCYRRITRRNGGHSHPGWLPARQPSSGSRGRPSHALDHPRLLARIIGQDAALRTAYGTQGAQLRYGRVYIAPPDLHLTFTALETFHLDHGPKINFHRPAANASSSRPPMSLVSESSVLFSLAGMAMEPRD